MSDEQEMNSRLGDARRKLLAEGARSYTQATTALIEFRREVIARSREVLQGRLRAYSEALGVPAIKVEKITEWSVPSERYWNGQEAGVGVTIAGLPVTLTEESGVQLWIYCGIYWDHQGSGSPWFGVYNGIGFSDKGFAEALEEAFTKLQLSCFGREGKETWTSAQIPPSEAGQFQVKLAESLDSWIAAWRQVGGLKGIGNRRA